MSDLTDNQIRGYKSTISNPRTSEEAKTHAQEKLNQAEEGMPGDSEPYAPEEEEGGVDNNRVLGGHKATLHNSNTSGEAKQHARDVLKSAGDGGDEPGSGTTRASSGDTGDEHTNRVLGGYKATLKNPNTSEEAKAHAQEVLETEGAM